MLLFLRICRVRLCSPYRVNRYNVLDSSSTGSRVRGKSEAGVRCAQSVPSLLPIRTMLILACILAVAAAAPATYDQRQDGEFNVRADVQNVVFLVAYPQKIPGFLPGLLNVLVKNAKQNEPVLQDRADIHVMEAFVEPSTPYRVEIGDTNSYDGDGRAVEVVIAGRRRMENEPQEDNRSEVSGEEYKLIGATEQCGPDMERDPVTFGCRMRSQPIEESPAPELPKEKPAVSEQPVPEVVQTS